MLRFRGEIAFAALAPPAQPLAVQARGTARSLATPGLALWWDARHADLDYRDGVMALAVGRARDATAAGAGEATRWCDRYARRNDAAADDVGGGFSVVVIDFNRRRAVMWIDRFGMEPLCYRSRPGLLSFADSASDVPGSARSIDRQALFDYLFFHVIPAPRTIYDDVHRLDAAHRLAASESAIDAFRYWTPRFIEHDGGPARVRMREFVETVRRAVDAEADEPATACFLSGGTDSSTVAGMLTRLRGVPAHAYSIGFAAEGYDEMAYARIAARHFGLAHHEHYLTPEDLVDAIPEVAASFDQPFGNSSVLPAYLCASRAREDGFTRMLAGDGGDELFGGNSRYAVQKAFELYHALPRALRQSVLEPAACDWRLFRRVPGFRRLGGYVRHWRAEMPDRLNAFNLLPFIGVDAILGPELLAHIDTGDPIERQREVWRSTSAGSLVNRMLEYDWKFTLADSDLPKVRAATQLAQMTVGYPFLGRGPTELSLRVPPGDKVKGFALRWFFKRALRGFLPAEILRKKKHGFGLPFGTWLVRHAPLRELAEDALAGVAGRGIVRASLANALLRERLPQAPGFYGELVWILLMLELWLRAHEGQAPVDADPGPAPSTGAMAGIRP